LIASDDMPPAAKLSRRLLAAWTAIVFAFLYAPIAILVAYSFNASRLNILWQGFTLRWYADVWHNAPLVRAGANSLVIGVLVTALSTVLGTGGAWLLHRYRFAWMGLVRTLIAIPMVMPEILMGISLLIFFTAVRMRLGFATVIIGHVTFCIPFVMSAVQARLDGIDPSLEEAALDLGATPIGAFWHVIIPYLRPAIAAGALMAFTLSLDELIVTFFTTSSASATLPIRIFGMAKVGLSPMLNALSAVFVVTAAALQLSIESLRRSGASSSPR
jgi:spermidine/putrescine transport system permease protein